ncbi:MAG: methionine biosynthesis protein MetW [Spirochaetia bacterium]
MDERTRSGFINWLFPHVADGSRVLDLGCGDGSLLTSLKKEKGIRGHGIDIDSDMVLQCLSKGVPVFLSDIEEGLNEFPSDSFDYVVLSRTLQAVKNPGQILKEIVRIGSFGIILFENFGYMPVRHYVMLKGSIPVFRAGGAVCSGKSFKRMCREFGIQILAEAGFTRGRKIPSIFLNSAAEELAYLVKRD